MLNMGQCFKTFQDSAIGLEGLYICTCIASPLLTKTSLLETEALLQMLFSIHWMIEAALDMGRWDLGGRSISQDYRFFLFGGGNILLFQSAVTAPLALHDS